MQIRSSAKSRTFSAANVAGGFGQALKMAGRAFKELSPRNPHPQLPRTKSQSDLLAKERLSLAAAAPTRRNSGTLSPQVEFQDSVLIRHRIARELRELEVSRDLYVVNVELLALCDPVTDPSAFANAWKVASDSFANHRDLAANLGHECHESGLSAIRGLPSLRMVPTAKLKKAFADLKCDSGLEWMAAVDERNRLVTQVKTAVVSLPADSSQKPEALTAQFVEIAKCFDDLRTHCKQSNLLFSEELEDLRQSSLPKVRQIIGDSFADVSKRDGTFPYAVCSVKDLGSLQKALQAMNFDRAVNEVGRQIAAKRDEEAQIADVRKFGQPTSPASSPNQKISEPSPRTKVDRKLPPVDFVGSLWSPVHVEESMAEAAEAAELDAANANAARDDFLTSAHSFMEDNEQGRYGVNFLSLIRAGDSFHQYRLYCKSSKKEIDGELNRVKDELNTTIQNCAKRGKFLLDTVTDEATAKGIYTALDRLDAPEDLRKSMGGWLKINKMAIPSRYLRGESEATLQFYK